MKRKLPSIRRPAMRLNPIMAALSLLALSPLPAAAVVTCSGSGASPEHGTIVSGEATFTLNTSTSPKTLTLVLKNTTTPATSSQGDALTGMVFNIGTNTAVLSYNGAANPTLGGPNMYLPGPVDGSWTDALASTIFGHYGVATTGFNGMFSASGITRGNGGPNYSIISGTSDPGFAQKPFIQNSLVFVFTTTSVFSESDISNVGFLFGTAGVTTTGTVVPCAQEDFGDAPDTGAGTGPGNYQTLLSDNGPRHVIVPGLRLGTVIDSESDGQPNAGATGDDKNGSPDDEDAVSALYLPRLAAPTVAVSVTNTLFQPASLKCWMDLNGDGDFADAGEASSVVTIPANSGTASYNVSFGSLTTTGTTYLRCRVSLIASEIADPFGPASSGEVEDHAVTVTGGLDFGDAPDTYGTLLASNGARHSIVANNPILGSIIDMEADGQPNAAATGDNNNPSGQPNDEDGVTSPLGFSNAQAPQITVNVSNPAANGAAILACWMDLNANGSFADAGERETATIAAGYSGPVNLTFNAITVGAGVTQTYLRCRISTDGNLLAATGYKGLMSNGEVEDYRVTINAASYLADYGDAPDDVDRPGPAAALNKTTPPAYQTRAANSGPSHTIIVGPKVFLGARAPDGDSGDLQNATATADNITDTGVVDDEDGITKIPTITIPAGTSTVSLSVGASNTTGSPATLACTAADALGNVCSTDPWFSTALRLKGSGAEATASERIATVNGDDDYVTISNGASGVQKLDITVNGTRFKVKIWPTARCATCASRRACSRAKATPSSSSPRAGREVRRK